MDKQTEITEDKVWITVSRTVNLGNYESFKIDAGYSQTIGGDNPMGLLKRAEAKLSAFVFEKTEEMKPKPKKKFRPREDRS